VAAPRGEEPPKEGGIILRAILVPRGKPLLTAPAVSERCPVCCRGVVPARNDE
jgi:hypothetical protein